METKLYKYFKTSYDGDAYYLKVTPSTTVEELEQSLGVITNTVPISEEEYRANTQDKQ